MNTSTRAFCALSLSDTNTAVRMILILHARQRQINKMLHTEIKIKDEAVFYLKMISSVEIKDFQQMLDDCCECGLIDGLQNLPPSDPLTEAMIRYAKGNGPIPDMVLQTCNDYRSAQKWLNRLGVKNDRLLDGIAFL